MTPRAYRRALTVGLIVILGWLPAAAAQAEERRYEGRTLSDWAHLLQDPDPSAQRKAVEALRLGFDVQAVPVLNRAAETGDASVRIEAIRALAQIQPPAPETIATLSKAMRDTDPAIQRAAAAALGDVGAVSVLAQALKDPDKDVRRNAVRPLRRVVIRDRSPSDPATTRAVVTALADALKDPDGGVRRAAVSSLGAIGPEAVDAIPRLARPRRTPTLPCVTPRSGRWGGSAALRLFPSWCRRSRIPGQAALPSGPWETWVPLLVGPSPP